ncbi:MAG: hypothetical protein FJX76_16635 [Armatimonadetes bacterium]|nr:hypothetical protein [Armatimonadota bacterium]
MGPTPMPYCVVVKLDSGEGAIAMRPDRRGPALLNEWEARGYAEMLRDEPGVVAAIAVPLIPLEERYALARAWVEEMATAAKGRIADTIRAMICKEVPA